MIFIWFFFLTVWQRSRELRQVFHTRAARADPSRPAGHRQHRPERVCRLLLHEPSVYPSIPAQRRMRREQKTPPHPPPTPMKKSMDCRRLQDSFQNSHGRPAVERLIPSSTVFCLLVNNDRGECSQVLKTVCVGEEKVHGTDDLYIYLFLHYFPQTSHDMFMILYLCFFLRTCSLFSRVRMRESVTVSLGIKDANPLFSFSSYSRCPVLPRNKLQCTTRTEHIFSAPSRLYLLLNRYTCILYLHTFGKKRQKRKR